MIELNIPADMLPSEMRQFFQNLFIQHMSHRTSSPSPLASSSFSASSSVKSSLNSILTSEAASSFSLTFPPQSTTSRTIDAHEKPQDRPPSIEDRSTSLKSGCDEVDGAPCESSVVHVMSLPRDPKTKREVLDDSDIVRVFPGHDEENAEEVDTMHSSTSHNDAEIVRIFPEKNDINDSPSQDPSSFRNFSSKSSSISTSLSYSECVQLQGKHRQPPSLSTSVRKLPQAQETKSPSFIITTPQKQQYEQQIFAPSPRRLSNHSPSHFDNNDFRTDLASLDAKHNGNIRSNNNITNVNSNCSQTVQRQQSPNLREPFNNKTRQPVKDSERGMGKFRQAPSISVSARRSPELPTPPQTPDDADIEDDEVFSYDVFGNNDESMSRRAFDVHRQNIESTPRRDSSHLRRNSDRSVELRHEAVHRSSPFSPAQKLSELSFGDRKHTRKRLSFEEEDVNPSTSPRPHFHSDPSLTMTSISNLAPPLFTAPQNILSFSGNSSCSSSNTSYCYSNAPSTSSNNVKYRPGLSKSLSPAPIPRVSTSDISPHKSQQLFQQSYSSANNATETPPPSPFHPSKHHIPPTSPFLSANNQLPIRDVMTALERSSNHNSLGTPRPRMYSDGDDFMEGPASAMNFYERGSPSTSHTLLRRQTVSYGKRRRIEEEVHAEQSTANQMMNLEPRDPANEACQDCTCAMIERSVLQMGERAYEKIRRIDSTRADFERFRNELAQTNDILRESLTIMNNFKSICEHKKRSSTPAEVERDPFS